VLLAGVPLLGAAACGDDDSDSTSSGDATTTTEMTEASTTTIDYSVLDAQLLPVYQAQYPGISVVEASRDRVRLSLHFDVSPGGETPDNFEKLAMLGVEAIQKDDPAVLDGVQDVRIHVVNESGENEQVYPYNEVQAWIEASGAAID
jgi:hypothetical protein